MRLLHLLWLHLPLQLSRQRAPEPWPDGPIVLGGRPWDPGFVLDADRAARDLGVRRGMTLGAAHRLVPEATFVEADPAADAAAVENALERLAAFSPGVAGVTESDDPSFGLLEVQLDGLERLWGPEPAMAERMAAGLQSVLPGAPRIGIAGTSFAATLAALRSPADGRTASSGAVPPGGERDFLAPLPASALSRDDEVRGRLARFGLRRIGDVAALPRSALVARFGPEGERIHARACGEEDRPFRPRHVPGRIALALPLEPAVAELEPLRFVLRRLVAALADQLAARGAAAGEVRLTLALDVTFAPPGTPDELAVEQFLPEPTAESDAMERLLAARLERTPPPAPVSRLELELAAVAPQVGQQLTLFTPQAGRAARLGWQLARLAVRFGEDRVGWTELLDPEAPLAEWRWRRRPAVSGVASSPSGGTPAPGAHSAGVSSAGAPPRSAIPAQPSGLARPARRAPRPNRRDNSPATEVRRRRPAR